jgi:glutathione S-transferase
MITLWGTPTSPYVRRTRIVAIELGLEFELRNTNDPGVQDELIAASPTWKIPTVRFDDGTVTWESAIIHDALIRRAGGALPGGGSLAIPGEEARLRIAAIDAALDAGIALFYMRRDAVDLSVPYLRKQRARIDAAMAWVTSQVESARVGTELSLDTVALVTTLDWFALRSAWPVQHPALLDAQSRWASRSSFLQTRPPA